MTMTIYSLYAADVATVTGLLQNHLQCLSRPFNVFNSVPMSNVSQPHNLATRNSFFQELTCGSWASGVLFAG